MEQKHDRTYLVEGSFNSSEIITNILLPKGTPPNVYKFKEEAYNISKKIGTKHFNAICIFMEEENSDIPLERGDTYFQNIFKIDNLIRNVNLSTERFEASIKECSITVIHNEYDEDLLKEAFDKLDTDFTTVQDHEPIVRIIPGSGGIKQPRVLGVSIIRR